jgi:pilus assembly protein CpaB
LHFRPKEIAGRSPCTNFAARLISGHFLLMVLGLWYSRAAFGRCYSGATCHTAGEKNLKRSSRVFLLGGIILAVIVFVLIILLFSNGNGGGGGTPPPPTTEPTVYATVDIPLGTQITSDMVAVHQVNITDRSATAFASVNDVVGQVIRTQVLANTDLNQSMFTSSTGINITENIDKGLRAMSVQVDQLTGVGTLIQAGDHVDAILGLGGTAGSCGAGWPALPPINPAATVKLIVQNLSVLGTLLPPPTAATPEASGGQVGPTLNGQQEIVIVGVSAQQAEVLRYGQIDGCISLVLRSPKDYAASSSAAPGASNGPVIPSLDPTTGVDLKTMIDQFGVLIPQFDPVIIPSASPAKK